MTEVVGSAVPVVETADVKNSQGFCGGCDSAAHSGNNMADNAPQSDMKQPEAQCDVVQLESRQAFIDCKVRESLEDLLDDSLYWEMPSGGTEPLWVEMRDAIMAKVFAIEHEMGVQKQSAEYVRDNCL